MSSDSDNSFSGVMNELLYGPDGFYTNGGGAGRSRDYLTSPEIGDLFGHVMAGYIDRWYEDLEYENAIVIDAGCGPGSLAASIARANLACANNITYVLVDVSEVHRNTAHKKLERLNPGFYWEVTSELPACDLPTLVIANELFDNLVFDIAYGDDIYNEDNKTPFEISFWESGIWGITSRRRIDPEIQIPLDLGHYRIPIHKGIFEWLNTLEQACADVTDLTVLAFDYMKSIVDMQDENWLRMYSENERIVGVDNVLEAIKNGAKGDITTDVIKEDLLYLFTQNGFTNKEVKQQQEWLKTNNIDYYLELLQTKNPVETPMSLYSKVQSFVENPQESNISQFEIERSLLLDENGLGAFSVLEAKRQV